MNKKNNNKKKKTLHITHAQMTKRTPFVCNSCVRRVTECAHSPPLFRAYIYYIALLRTRSSAAVHYLYAYNIFLSKKHTRDTARINNASCKNKNRTQYP